MNKEEIAANQAQANRTVRLIRQTSFEALIRSHKAEQDPALLQEIKEIAGYDFYRPKPQYNFIAYGKIIGLFCQKFYPQKSLDDALTQIADRQNSYYFHGTMYGKVAWAALSSLSPQKFIERFLQIHKDNFNYGNFSVEFPDDCHGVITATDDPSSPVFIAAILQSLLDDPESHFKNAKVNYKSVGKYHAIYELSWDS